MIKLEITIKEINSLDFKEMTAIGTEITIKEIGREATKNEKEVSNILKVDEKFQVETKKDELKAELEKLLKSL